MFHVIHSTLGEWYESTGILHVGVVIKIHHGLLAMEILMKCKQGAGPMHGLRLVMAWLPSSTSFSLFWRSYNVLELIKIILWVFFVGFVSLSVNIS